jgi:hypothetical protein
MVSARHDGPQYLEGFLMPSSILVIYKVCQYYCHSQHSTQQECEDPG